jgi:tetrahydromethanopterin S-methyltransferase subunit G
MLHNAVVVEIQRMAAHPWRVGTVVEEAVRHLPRAEHLEAEATLLTRRLRDIEKKIERVTDAVAAAKVTRPTVADVHRRLGRFSELWEAATEEERAELLP